MRTEDLPFPAHVAVALLGAAAVGLAWILMTFPWLRPVALIAVAGLILLAVRACPQAPGWVGL